MIVGAEMPKITFSLESPLPILLILLGVLVILCIIGFAIEAEPLALIAVSVMTIVLALTCAFQYHVDKVDSESSQEASPSSKLLEA